MVPVCLSGNKCMFYLLGVIDWGYEMQMVSSGDF